MSVKFWSTKKCRLCLGDCLDVLKLLPANSIDAVVTDPPYGWGFMGSNWDSFKEGDIAMRRNPQMNAVNTGSSKQGGRQRSCADYQKRQARDMQVFQEYMTDVFSEVLRVAKPGAHLLAFGGPRTFHRLAVAIEDAGWESRDCIMWVYSTGFPKSLNASKAIDRKLGAKEIIVGRRKHPTLKDTSKVEEQAAAAHGSNKWSREWDITEPVTTEAKTWRGWGSALKPAWEPIILARKSLEGTIAANILKWETGGLNIDGCRIELSASDPLRDGVKHKAHDLDTRGQGWGFKAVDRQAGLGRFPANVMHDGSDDVMRLFPNTNASKRAKRGDGIGSGYRGSDKARNTVRGYGDLGGSAARFFYCSKASRRDRDDGLDDHNDHPTVKPTDLMRYLCRLIVPPNGVVLDPFMGSGSTGKAAVLEGFRFFGIDLDDNYCKIARGRIEFAER